MITVICVSLNLYRVSPFSFYTILYSGTMLHFIMYILKKILDEEETIYDNNNKGLYKKSKWEMNCKSYLNSNNTKL